MTATERATEKDGILQVSGSRKTGTYRTKRALDVMAAVVGLVIATPFAALIALLIRLTSPGPVLFKQGRIGKDGKEFKFYKFRTMRVNNDDSQHRQYMKLFIEGKEEALRKFNGQKKLYKIAKDDRVTAVGRFLRRTSLDELPQLINVLKGDMSMVGPRPHIPYEVSLYKDWHRKRLNGLPGVTGWWQVHGRSRVTFDKSVEMDIWYLEHQSLILDIRIMLRTISKAIVGRGAC